MPFTTVSTTCVSPRARKPPDGLDAVSAPPGALIAAPVKFAVMRPAQWHGELVTDLLSKSPRLRKAQMMRVAGLPATDEAGLFGDEAQVLSISLPQRFWDCERSLTGYRWLTWIDLCVGLRRFRCLAWHAQCRQSCVKGFMQAFGIFQAKRVDGCHTGCAHLSRSPCREWLDSALIRSISLEACDGQGACARRASGLSGRLGGAAT